MKKNRLFIRPTALILCLGLCLALLLPGCQGQPSQPESTEASGAAQAATVSKEKEILFHIGQQSREYVLAFTDEACQIPMISIDDAVALLSQYIRENRDGSFAIELTTPGQRITLTRDHGATCVLDFDNKTLFFPDYNAFHQFSYELGALDILESTAVDSQGEPAYFQRVLCSEKPALPSTVDLAAYDIPFFLHGQKGYMTLQTFSDLFLTPYEIMLSYNQEAVYLLKAQELSAIPESYYAAQPAPASQAFAQLRYRQLCLLLDFHYGLQQEHGIASADAYLTQLGLKEALCSTDPQVSYSALKTLFYKYLSDNHSNVMLHSVFDAEPNNSLGAQEASIGYWEFVKNYQLYSSLRQEQFGDSYRPYEELGNTAFVTFDSFSSVTADYYKNPPTADALNDEIALICYAHSQITRQDSPIENVVIDLTTNTGGHMDGGIFLTAWVLGNSIIHITDPVRQAEGTFLYRADVNLDRTFDAADTISDKNVFVIVSPLTFSCANYAAYALQESGKVTLLGATTGGGTACVYSAALMDGSAVSFSASLRMSGYKNGTYYSLDSGIAPDVKFAKVSDYFDRQRILEIINGLV